jgi:hypothetical protein
MKTKPNKQKAWRTNAFDINSRRILGSDEPVARVQKLSPRIDLGKTNTWLLDWLLIRGGFMQDLPGYKFPSIKDEGKPWYRRMLNSMANFFAKS